MEGLILFIHIVVCLLLVIVVLLQSGKSADLAGAFGGMGSQSTFGPRGSASFMSKMTTTLAVLFMVTSLTLWIFASNKTGGDSVITAEDGVTQGQTTGDTTDDKGTTGDDAKGKDATGTEAGKTDTKETGTEATGTDPAKDKTGPENAAKTDGTTGDNTQQEQKKPAEKEKQN